MIPDGEIHHVLLAGLQSTGVRRAGRRAGRPLMLVERNPGASAELVGDRWLVVDPAGRNVVTLSPTGSVVWDAIDGERDDAALVRHLLDRTTGGTLEQAEADVGAFVSELLAAGLVRRVDAPG